MPGGRALFRCCCAGREKTRRDRCLDRCLDEARAGMGMRGPLRGGGLVRCLWPAPGKTGGHSCPLQVTAETGTRIALLQNQPDMRSLPPETGVSMGWFLLMRAAPGPSRPAGRATAGCERQKKPRPGGCRGAAPRPRQRIGGALGLRQGPRVRQGPAGCPHRPLSP